MSRRWEDMNERERWLIQVEEKMKRGNQILFDRNSVLLQPLIDLLCVQNRRAVVLWCLDGMEEILERIRLIDPTETRAEEAVRQCRLWAAGEIRNNVGHITAQTLNSVESANQAQAMVDLQTEAVEVYVAY